MEAVQLVQRQAVQPPLQGGHLEEVASAVQQRASPPEPGRVQYLKNKPVTCEPRAEIWESNSVDGCSTKGSHHAQTRQGGTYGIGE